MKPESLSSCKLRALFRYCCLCICQLQCDLVEERVVSPEEVMALAKEVNCPHFETSALNRINVDEAFHEVCVCVWYCGYCFIVIYFAVLKLGRFEYCMGDVNMLL